MSDTVDALILDLLEWMGPEPRPYAEVLEAWRTSCPRLPVWEDANARGFGTFKSQPLKEQNVNGWGVWHDGFWNVVFIRDLKSRNTDDVKFVPGKPTKVAFAIWDGQNRDRNGRKVISNWYNLILEP